MALKRWFSERYLTADPRALGAGRIVLASVLLLDLARRARDLGTWYTNEGLLPNHTTLWRPPFDYTLSLFFTASKPTEATVGFVLCGLAYLMLLLGVRTRVAHVCSLVAVLSLHGRCEFVQNGGDAVLGEVTLFSCFLPTGLRYSIDAVRRARSLGGSWAEEARRPVVALGVGALAMQLAVIYFFNALQKTGATWRAGTVVHYMLHQDCNNTWLAVLIRDHFTLLESKILTWTAWGIEGVLPFFILCPFWQRYTRRIAVFLVVALHGGFATFLNLGIFVPAMISFTPFLLTAADYDALERFVAGRGWAASLAKPLARLIPVREWLVARAAVPAGERQGPASVLALSELWDGLLGVLLVCVTSQVLSENTQTTHFKPEWQPKWMQACALYLQAFQGWAMYAPDPPIGDINIHVDAVTLDGRHVDPFNEAASPGNRRPGKDIPAHLGQDVLYFAYVLRMPWMPDYYPAFEDWILAYPRRTHRQQDTIASFEAFVVEHDSPPPGEHGSRNPRSRSFLKYPRR